MLNNLISLYNGGAAASTTSYESIATVTVGAGGSSSITFSSIPSTYKHLQLRILARSTSAANQVGMNMQFNGDTAANYAQHYIYGDGAGTASGASTSATSLSYQYATGTGASANIFAANIIDILDYQNTNKYKTVRTMSGWDLNGGGYIQFSSGLWQSTNALNQIVLNASLAQYSQFALYGVKG